MNENEIKNILFSIYNRNELLLLREIIRFQLKYNKVCPSQQTLAESLNLNRRTIIRLVQTLKERSLLMVESKKFKTLLYFVNPILLSMESILDEAIKISPEPTWSIYKKRMEAPIEYV